MTQEKPTGSETKPDQEMRHLRELILGKDNAQIKQVLSDNAREVVGDVVIEAIHDREKKDGALNTVLVPIVEKSVQTSVNKHGEQLVGYLYPLVGRLVRKSVSAFLIEFLDKTNQLIENSLTIRGIAWRFKAWQAGVSFSQYVASQTFVFRVEQVLLIHKETGILLNSVSRSNDESADADLVSGMLTAINDFVSDSFQTTQKDNEQHLEVIKTEDFSLVIKRGPQLVLVAAVTGNIPQDISTKFQITNERIHKLFASDINEFSGDTVPFEATRNQLEECLLAELRPEAKKDAKKRPIWAILILLLAFAAVGYWGYMKYQQNSLAERVSRLSQEPGILLLESADVGWQNLAIKVLRDPEAVPLQQWFDEKEIDASRISADERAYLSLEVPILKKRVERLLSRYPTVAYTWEENDLVLSGLLPNAQRQMLARELFAVPGMQNPGELIKGIDVEELTTADEDSPEILRALFEISRAKIDSTQIEFEQGASSLTKEAKAQLRLIAGYLKSAIELSKKLELNVGLIIMGASDSSGSKLFNQSLSRKRAQAAQAFLVEQGIDASYLNAIGLGVVEIKATGSGARKVIFNVIDFKTD